MRAIEIVSHCWQYSRLLAYQITSAIRHAPPTGSVKLTIYYAPVDHATIETLDFFRRAKEEWNGAANLTIDARPLPRRSLFNRNIGRNMAALSTSADWIWFTDCDYAFGPKCFPSLTKLDPEGETLVYPQIVQIHKNHELGDRYINQVDAIDPWSEIDPDDFLENRQRRAIGGIQIVPGDVARQVGYNPKQQRVVPDSVELMPNPRGDTSFRRGLETSGKPVAIEDVFRLRHTKAGRFEKVVN